MIHAPLALLALVGCVHTCTLMYVPDFVDVTLVADSWEPGEWEVEVLGEVCTVELPDDQSLSCDGDVLFLNLSEDGQALSGLQLMGEAPDSFEVVLRLDGVELLSETVTPDYVEDEPNGEGCGTQRSGTATLAL